MADSYEDVLLAVLSMDTYMRDWKDLARNLGKLGNQIGNAIVNQGSSILGSDVNGVRIDQTNMFFAQTYSDSTYGTIISYRGIGGTSEFLNAVRIAGGAVTVRVDLAAEFYQRIASLDAQTPFTANVIFTGHSMGGALAGIIASVYGKQAVVFDNTGFEFAVSRITKDAAIEVPSILTTFYSSVDPRDDIPTFDENVRGYAVSGDIAEATRGFQHAPIVTMKVGSLVWPVGGLGPIDRHNVQLAAILTYGYDLVPQSSKWQDAAGYFTGYLFNNSIAQALGVTSDTSNGFDASYFMRTEIAYSAINSGVMPYGDTGIASLYADVGTLGQLIDNGSLTGLVDSKEVGKALGEIIVQQAGDLAASANKNAAAANGSLSQSSNVLTVNLNPDNWVASFNNTPASTTTPNIIGLGDLFNAVLANVSAQMSSYGPLYLQGEYSWYNVERNNLPGLPSVKFDGGYAQASYVLTGENHPYNPASASYGGVVPANPFSLIGGGWGAWEIGGRVSTMNLDDQLATANGVAGGKQTVYTAALNW